MSIKTIPKSGFPFLRIDKLHTFLLIDQYKSYILIHMLDSHENSVIRTTINLNQEVYEKAAEATGVEEKTALIHMGLRSLIEQKARERLGNLYGKIRNAKASPRRKVVW